MRSADAELVQALHGFANRVPIDAEYRDEIAPGRLHRPARGSPNGQPIHLGVARCDGTAMSSRISKLPSDNEFHGR